VADESESFSDSFIFDFLSLFISLDFFSVKSGRPQIFLTMMNHIIDLDDLAMKKNPVKPFNAYYRYYPNVYFVID